MFAGTPAEPGGEITDTYLPTGGVGWIGAQRSSSKSALSSVDADHPEVAPVIAASTIF
jgi:hypothetical protein